MAVLTHKDGTAAAILMNKQYKKIENDTAGVLKIANEALNKAEYAIEIASGGGGSSGDKHFTYTQATPSATWHITHGLGKVPSVTVIDSAGSSVVGDCEIVDNNNIILYFNGAFSGKAYLN